MKMKRSTGDWESSEDDIKRIAKELAAYENIGENTMNALTSREVHIYSHSSPISNFDDPAIERNSHNMIDIDDALSMVHSLEQEDMKTKKRNASHESRKSYRNSDRKSKPSFSYIALISMAILSTREKRMLLGDIYRYIMEQYPYYKSEDRAWRNSIRHNLSLNECFVKDGKADTKGNYWAIHPACVDDFSKGDFRRRHARQRARCSDLQRNAESHYVDYRGCRTHYIPMSVATSYDYLQQYVQSISSL